MRSVFTARWIAACLGVSLVLSCHAARAADDLRRGPQAAWVQTAEAAAPAPDAPAGEGLRILLFDNQVRADGQGEASYFRMRSQALSPQALAVLGSVGVTWSPASQEVTVHHVTIIRDGESIDALDGQAFETLRREQNLEQAMLDGLMTAVLQLSGLRVGDILDVAYTTTSRDPVTGGHFEQTIDLNLPAAVDRVRYRASWPASLAVRSRAANDWTAPNVRRVGDQSVMEINLQAVQPITVTEDVPARFQAARRIELTDYRDWSDIAVALKPLYDEARSLTPTSPLQVEIERIRALSDDPTVQAAAALQLVQDRIRYVALMMGAGGLTPATADETWSRRFGDCKAKTALLLALLDGLGIAAEPASVSTMSGDGMDQTLPRISAFDHILVRAVINGRTYWLDGTKTGDRTLDQIAVPPFHWALALTGPQARLEALIVPPLEVPTTETAIVLDATAGLYVPAVIDGTMTVRGDAAAVLGGQLAMIPAAQKDEGLRAVWAAQFPASTITEVASAYDAEASVLTLTLKGAQALDWSSDGLILPGTLYPAITTRQRPEGPFRNAPYALAHPGFSRSRTTLRLPAGGQGFRVSGGEVNRTELGHETTRTVRLDGETVTVDLSIRSLTGEVSAADADAVRPIAGARPYDPPRVVAPDDYRPSAEDHAALEADRPTTAAGWLARGFALSGHGDFTGAVEAANEAVALEPENSSALANRGVYRFHIGDKTGAAEDLAKAADIDPSERIAMNGHALLAIDRGEYQDAVVELSRALRQAPGDRFALGNRAYLALNQYDRALRDIDALIAEAPTESSLKMMRIFTLQQAERLDEADREMALLAEANPDSRPVRLTQADMRMKRGDAQGAVDILTLVLDTPQVTEDEEIEGPDSSALIMRAEAYIALRRLDDAARDFATVRDAYSDEAPTLNNLCWSAAKAGALLDQALRDCDAALALSPGSASFMDSRGRVLLQLGDPAAALASYDAALAKAPDLAASLYGRGLARIALGRVEEGEADKAAAIARLPSVIDSFAAYPPEG